MRVALTYNLERHGVEGDSPETIAQLSGILRSLGHDVAPVDVTGPVAALVERLSGDAPDLVFNIAEGTRGRFREAFFPALFEQLGLAYTGSSAATLALCLDKALSKRIVAAAGVRVARGGLVRSVDELAALDLASSGRSGRSGRAARFMVKPNFEGSSIGITQESVVERAELAAAVGAALAAFPDGVLVEEYIDGDDVAVAWVSGLGLLPSIRYEYDASAERDRADGACRAHRILDFAVKRAPSRVKLRCPAYASDVRTLGTALDDVVMDAAARSFDALEVDGFGRADFRVTPSGDVVFLEMNPLPSLAPDDPELFLAAARLGRTPEDVLAAICAAAST